jgi:SAM-dependent methyltransferase
MAPPTKHSSLKIIDVGCGPNKLAGSFGVDVFPFPGVDQVFDLNDSHWPIEKNQYDFLRASHVIEHVEDTKTFLKEIHRICKPGAEVLIETPHFSWIDSWNDPTHKWHFSSGWYRVLGKGQYLGTVVGEFELVSSKIEFNKSVRSLIPRLIAFLFGDESYEKHYSFIFPARNIHTRLRVVK